MATIRFETAPGHQLQIDFGERRVLVGGREMRVYFFVAVLVRITIRQMTTNIPALNSRLIHPGASRKNVPAAQSTSMTIPAISPTSIRVNPI